MDLVTSVNTPVVVVAQDTDVLVLLCYHRPNNCSNLYLQSDADGLYDISTIDIVDRKEFLFKYGWSGKNTVSCIHGHTKCALYKCNYLPVSSLHSQVSLQLNPQFKQLD